MDTEIDELLEEEYAAQQEGESHIPPVEVNGEKEKKQEIEISVLLVDISETLRLLNEQMIWLDETTKTLPQTVDVLRTITVAVQNIANELPAMVRERCLEEYRNIIENAVKNYNQMQKSAIKWQKSTEERRTEKVKMITISAILTPLLLLLNLILK